MQVIHSENAPKAIGPYSQAMVSGNFVFASGQTPLSPQTGTLVGGAIEEQTEQVIKNLSAVLEAAGTDILHVVKTTCFLLNMADFAAFNAVYGKHFTQNPARSTFAVKELPKGALVEIEVIAEK